jgi:hypothetical protein
MPARANKVSPALKHGAYSEATLLPGEDPDDFKKMHMGLIAELAPNGRLEKETVAEIAKLELAPVSLDTTLSDGTGKEWPS